MATEDVPRLVRRARWTSDGQLSTYVQEVTPLEVLAELSGPVKRRLYDLAALLPDFVALSVTLLQTRTPTTGWYELFRQRFLSP